MVRMFQSLRIIVIIESGIVTMRIILAADVNFTCMWFCSALYLANNDITISPLPI